MKRYFMNLFQEIKEDCFPGKDNMEIIIELAAHAINAAIIIFLFYIVSHEWTLLFFNN